MDRTDIATRILAAGMSSGDSDATPDQMVQVSVRLADMLLEELIRTQTEKINTSLDSGDR